MKQEKNSRGKQPRVGLFVTCLADGFRPNVGLAAVTLLERSGCVVEFPLSQTCCGQPSYNNGDLPEAALAARRTMAAFRDLDYVVVPSGSCAGMLRDYPRLFADDPEGKALAEEFAARVHELVSFLTDIMGVTRVDVSFPHSVTYHDSCHGLRALGIKHQPRQLLGSIPGLALCEMADSETCCGFGGTFCVKYPEISGKMVADKSHHIEQSGCDVVLGGDLGCLLNIAGRLGQTGSRVRVYHVAEVLAGLADVPAIGASRGAAGQER